MNLEKAADNANQNVSFSGIASQVGSFDNPWLLFSKYIDAINKQCEEVILPKWESKLGGAEIFMSTHCFTMTQSGRVDPTIQALFQSFFLVFFIPLNILHIDSKVSYIPKSVWSKII